MEVVGYRILNFCAEKFIVTSFGEERANLSAVVYL